MEREELIKVVEDLEKQLADAKAELSKDDFERVTDIDEWVHNKIYTEIYTYCQEYYMANEFLSDYTGYQNRNTEITEKQDIAGDVAPTYEEATALWEYKKAFKKYINAIRAFNRYYNWKVDWTDDNQRKYVLYIDRHTDKIDCTFYYSIQRSNSQEMFSESVFNNTKMFNYLKQLYSKLIEADNNLSSFM